MVRRLTAQFRDVSKLRDWQRCREACQISERMETSKAESRGFETSWYLVVRHPSALSIIALVRWHLNIELGRSHDILHWSIYVGHVIGHHHNCGFVGHSWWDNTLLWRHMRIDSTGNWAACSTACSSWQQRKYLITTLLDTMRENHWSLWIPDTLDHLCRNCDIGRRFTDNIFKCISINERLLFWFEFH